MTQFPLNSLSSRPTSTPGPVQQVFQYCLATLMVEGGKARLVGVATEQEETYCTFETVTADLFTLVRPPISEAYEKMMSHEVREILIEERL